MVDDIVQNYDQIRAQKKSIVCRTEKSVIFVNREFVVVECPVVIVVSGNGIERDACTHNIILPSLHQREDIKADISKHDSD